MDMKFLLQNLLITAILFPFSTSFASSGTDANIENVVENYDTEKYPWINDPKFSKSVREATKLALNEASGKGPTLKTPAEINYELTQMVLKYMNDHDVSSDVAVQMVAESLNKNFDDVKLYLKASRANEIINPDDTTDQSLPTANPNDSVSLGQNPEVPDLNNEVSYQNGDEGNEKITQSNSEIDINPDDVTDQSLPTANPDDSEPLSQNPEVSDLNKEVSYQKANDSDEEITPNISEYSGETNSTTADDNLNKSSEDQISNYESHSYTSSSELIQTNGSEEPVIRSYKSEESMASESHTLSKNIFELIDCEKNNPQQFEKKLKEKLNEIKSIYTTEIATSKNEKFGELLNEQRNGNRVVVVDNNDIFDISNELSYRYGVQLTEYMKDGQNLLKDNPTNYDIIDSPTLSFLSESEIRKIIQMQITIAIITGHDVLITSSYGDESIAKIYTGVLNDPLVKGKLKKVLIVS